MEEREFTKHIFDTLKVDREEIERSVDAGSRSGLAMVQV